MSAKIIELLARAIGVKIIEKLLRSHPEVIGVDVLRSSDVERMFSNEVLQ